MTFHALDGTELQVEAADAGFVGSLQVDGRKATRVIPTCGTELVVAEDENRVLSSVMSEYGNSL